MSTKILSLISFLFCCSISFGQLKVHSNGTVSVATTTYTGWGLTVSGYAALRCINGTNHLRFSPGSYDATIGTNTDVIAFWESGLLYHDVHCEDLSESSDSLLKVNIAPLELGLETVLQLKPKSYNRKTEDGVVESESSFGFLAQDVQLIKPELVVMGHDSTLLLHTTQIIPYLVSAIQEQQLQIDSLLSRVTELESSVYDGGIGTKSVGITTNENGELIELGQNNPNPFKESTAIPYSIPTSATSAQIIIYDMRGIELKSYNLENFNEGQLIIEGSTFKAGMYMYALIVDGNYIDSKRMILSK